MHYVHLDDKTRNTIIRYLLYGLLGVAIFLLTILLTFAAQGYDIDRDSGRVFQNGLIQVNTQPSGSFITLDGNVESPKTPARLAVHEGTHNLVLSQEGFRNWEKSFELLGSEVLWYYYPLLVPNQIETTNRRQLNNLSDFSQNPSKDDIVLLERAENPILRIYNGDNIAADPEVVTLSASDFSRNPKNGSLRIYEWAPNNRHLIVQHIVNDNPEYFLVDTRGRDTTVNLNTEFKFDFENIAFGDDEEEFFTLKNGNIRQATLSDSLVSSALVSKVVEYKVASDGDVWTISGTELPKIQKFNGDITENMYQTNKSIKSLTLGHGRNSGFVSVIRSDKEVLVFEDLKPQSEDINVPDKVIAMDKVRKNEFSEGNDMILVSSNDRALTYEIEKKRIWPIVNRAKISIPRLRWVGTHHLASIKDNQVYILDHDGDNQFQITDAMLNSDIFIAKNQESIYTLEKSSANSNKLFQVSDLTIE